MLISRGMSKECAESSTAMRQSMLEESTYSNTVKANMRKSRRLEWKPEFSSANANTRSVAD